MKIVLFLSFIFMNLVGYSQELPPIIRFSPDEYKGENQNWMISQDGDKYIYVANNTGLLEFNGEEWSIYLSPNNTIIRAVKVIGDKIYTGCYAEFGYWIKNDLGILEYNSLIPGLRHNTLEDEQIWNILEYNGWVVFQSNKSIYFYNDTNQSFKVISASNIIYKIFKIKDRIYYHVANEGIYSIIGGEPQLIMNDQVILSDRVINIFERKNNLTILTRKSGFYTFKNDKLYPWNTTTDGLLKDVDVFSSIHLEDESLILGTISDGILHLDKDGNLKYQITQVNGLSNNTVLTLFEDDRNNLWIGLDNGINCVNIHSAIKIFYDYKGELGTVYSTQVYKGILYVGSNQGLFYKKLDVPNEKFKFIEGTAGQVWNLYNYQNKVLFCGHHLGTFTINGHQANKISDILGAWIMRPVPNKEKVLLQGNYDGIYVFEQSGNTWGVRNKIEGFKNSTRYLEINDSYNIWVNHEYKGVFKMHVNDNLTNVTDLSMESNLPLGKNSSLIKYRNNILYTSDSGSYKYDESLNKFIRDSSMSEIIEKEDYTSGKLIVDENTRLWAFTKENIKLIENDNITNKPIIHDIPIPSNLRKGISGFENISPLNEDVYILGTANGYITLDISKIDNDIEYSIYLNSILLKDLDDNIFDYSIKTVNTFNYNPGLLTFKYSIPEYNKHHNVKYQYKLDGIKYKWSKWSEEAKVTFEKLPFGDYTLLVRGNVGNQFTNNTLSYSFKIKRPWYLSNLALALYSLMAISITLLIHKTYKRYYHKKFIREKLEKEQIIMQINNEKLNQEIESKNRELAISTMSIIKKNEVLNSIKKELKKSMNTDVKAAIKLIDRNLNDAQDWSFFEQAFNNADKDFLDKISEVHPDLTPNDLRFCAYLRLNLSSKEIAPLLNISIKSVETKRYRLRKKLGLDHEEGLVNYIIKF